MTTPTSETHKLVSQRGNGVRTGAGWGPNFAFAGVSSRDAFTLIDSSAATRDLS
jgi:hypothetical protein